MQMKNYIKIKKLILIGISFVFLTNCNSEQDQKNIKVEPLSSFKSINIERQKNAILQLNSDNKEIQLTMIDSILNDSNAFSPPVLFLLSTKLFELNKKDDAAFWYYTGQLRARYDANLCTDESAKSVATILSNEYGLKINEHSMQNINNLEVIVKKVVDFVRTNNENYDHRWISLHGMNAMQSGLNKNETHIELTLPRNKWSEIKKSTVDTYYNDFLTYVVNGKK